MEPKMQRWYDIYDDGSFFRINDGLCAHIRPTAALRTEVQLFIQTYLESFSQSPWAQQLQLTHKDCYTVKKAPRFIDIQKAFPSCTIQYDTILPNGRWENTSHDPNWTKEEWLQAQHLPSWSCWLFETEPDERGVRYTTDHRDRAAFICAQFPERVMKLMSNSQWKQWKQRVNNEHASTIWLQSVPQNWNIPQKIVEIEMVHLEESSNEAINNEESNNDVLSNGVIEVVDTKPKTVEIVNKQIANTKAKIVDIGVFLGKAAKHRNAVFRSFLNKSYQRYQQKSPKDNKDFDYFSTTSLKKHIQGRMKEHEKKETITQEQLIAINILTDSLPKYLGISFYNSNFSKRSENRTKNILNYDNKNNKIKEVFPIIAALFGDALISKILNQWSLKDTNELIHYVAIDYIKSRIDNESDYLDIKNGFWNNVKILVNKKDFWMKGDNESSIDQIDRLVDRFVQGSSAAWLLMNWIKKIPLFGYKPRSIYSDIIDTIRFDRTSFPYSYADGMPDPDIFFGAESTEYFEILEKNATSERGENKNLLEAVFSPKLIPVQLQNKNTNELLVASAQSIQTINVQKVTWVSILAEWKAQQKAEQCVNHFLGKDSNVTTFIRKNISSPRNENNISGKDLMLKFGISGLQFGMFVPHKERQLFLNDTYDALHDLSQWIGIEPHCIGLPDINGRSLSIAFGARGKGGLSAAAAHYEAAQHVINITRRCGRGCLAHEWLHALDVTVGHWTAGDTYTQEKTFASHIKDHPFNNTAQFKIIPFNVNTYDFIVNDNLDFIIMQQNRYLNNKMQEIKQCYLNLIWDDAGTKSFKIHFDKIANSWARLEETLLSDIEDNESKKQTALQWNVPSIEDRLNAIKSVCNKLDHWIDEQLNYITKDYPFQYLFGEFGRTVYSNLIADEINALVSDYIDEELTVFQSTYPLWTEAFKAKKGISHVFIDKEKLNIYKGYKKYHFKLKELVGEYKNRKMRLDLEKITSIQSIFNQKTETNKNFVKADIGKKTPYYNTNHEQFAYLGAEIIDTDLRLNNIENSMLCSQTHWIDEDDIEIHNFWKQCIVPYIRSMLEHTPLPKWNNQVSTLKEKQGDDAESGEIYFPKECLSTYAENIKSVLVYQQEKEKWNPEGIKRFMAKTLKGIKTEEASVHPIKKSLPIWKESGVRNFSIRINHEKLRGISIDGLPRFLNKLSNKYSDTDVPELFFDQELDVLLYANYSNRKQPINNFYIKTLARTYVESHKKSYQLSLDSYSERNIVLFNRLSTLCFMELNLKENEGSHSSLSDYLQKHPSMLTVWEQQLEGDAISVSAVIKELLNILSDKDPEENSIEAYYWCKCLEEPGKENIQNFCNYLNEPFKTDDNANSENDIKQLINDKQIMFFTRIMNKIAEKHNVVFHMNGQQNSNEYVDDLSNSKRLTLM